jgi:hypothetical protein
MARINIYAPLDEYAPDERRPVVGWYDPDKAVAAINENTEWNGNTLVSVVAGGAFEHETLYLTKAGRWVLYHWSQWQRTAPTSQFLTATEARDWLTRNGSDDEIERHFGETLEEEAGPPVMGRPEIGGRVTTALGEERLAAVDLWAADRSMKRAEAIRRLLDVALAQAAGQS